MNTLQRRKSQLGAEVVFWQSRYFGTKRASVARTQTRRVLVKIALRFLSKINTEDHLCFLGYRKKTKNNS